MIVILMIFFISLAGASKAVMDILQFKYNDSVFNRTGWKTFWDAQHSWKNKYKNGDKAQGERFWLSTTWLVFVTDGWHLAQFFAWNSIFTVLGLAMIQQGMIWWHAAIGATMIALMFKSVFRLFYKKWTYQLIIINII